LLKNPSKSTLAHDAVAAAVLHKHHPIIPIGAGLIQFVYDLRSRLANRGYPSEKSISAIFRASFSASLNSFASRDLAISVYFACASSNGNAWSRCFSTLRTSDVSPTLAMAQILPLTNPSTSVGGTSAHWHSS